MNKIPVPEIMRRFSNLLWCHSPVTWIMKTTYFQGTLFVSMQIPSDDDKDKIIRRSFFLKDIKRQENNIHELSADCVDEMKRSL